MTNTTFIPDRDGRVWLLARSRSAARRMALRLAACGLGVEVCREVADFCAGLATGTGAALVTEQALAPPTLAQIVEALPTQLEHANPPLIVMARRRAARETSEPQLDVLRDGLSVIWLERPIGSATAAGVVRAALREREARTQLHDAQARHERELEQLAARNRHLEERATERAEVAETRAARLRALALELTQAEQRERRRLAELLHDHLQQLLVAAKLSLGAARRRVEQGDIADFLRQVDALIDESIDASRSLAVELSPPILYDGGLGPALEWLGRQMHKKHGLTVSVDIRDETEPEGDDTKVFVFQAVRELLFNVVKHAPGAWVRVTLTSDGERWLRVCVEDDGPGVDPAVFARDAGEAGGFGLLNIRERLRLLGGRLLLDESRPQGTGLTLFVPRRERGPSADAPRRRASAGGRRTAATSESRRLIRVLLADDHRIVRQGLFGLLEEQPDVEVVGQASDGAEAVEEALRLRPDVVVMDISMPKMNGIEATRRITAALPDVRVIGLSLHEQEKAERAMREAGAAVLLSKAGASDDLCRAIRDARAGVAR